MPAAPEALNEADRLNALKRSGLLDSPPDHYLQDILEDVAQSYDVPIALVSLVDEHRQWFMGRFGLDATETHRDSAFCAYTILQEESLVVLDPVNDPRFSDNPLVTGELGIRFYAGLPIALKTGEIAGSLCIIDTVKHDQAPQLHSLELAKRRVERRLLELHASSGLQPRERDVALPQEITERDGECRISVRGDIVSSSAHRWFDGVAKSEAVIRSDHVVLDLSDCRIIDSSGIGSIVKLYKVCQRSSKKLTLRNLNPLVRVLFARLRLDRVFAIEG